MKLIFSILFIFFSAQKGNAQTFSHKIDHIKEKYDLMGGIVLTFDKNEIKQIVPFGFSNYHQKTKVNDTTIFRIASISKTITALAVMKLFEDKLIDLNNDINSILDYSVRNPNFPDTPITTKMLLSHTSTIIDGKTYNNFIEEIHKQGQVANIRELLTPNGSYYSESQFFNQKPGSYFKYSNINFGILGTIVEKVSGLRFDQYCKKFLFGPLDISGSFNKYDLSAIKNLSTLYRKKEGKWVVQADGIESRNTKKDYSNYIPGTNSLLFSPQGGLRISGSDLAKIFQLIINEGKYKRIRILNKKTIRKMIVPNWNYSKDNGDNYYDLFRSWGLGIHIITNTNNSDRIFENIKNLVGHPGEAYGLISDAYVDLKTKTGFIIIINGSGTGYTTGKHSAFYTVEKDIFEVLEKLSIFKK